MGGGHGRPIATRLAVAPDSTAPPSELVYGMGRVDASGRVGDSQGYAPSAGRQVRGWPITAVQGVGFARHDPPGCMSSAKAPPLGPPAALHPTLRAGSRTATPSGSIRRLRIVKRQGVRTTERDGRNDGFSRRIAESVLHPGVQLQRPGARRSIVRVFRLRDGMDKRSARHASASWSAICPANSVQGVAMADVADITEERGPR